MEKHKSLKVFEYQTVKVGQSISGQVFQEKHFNALSRYGYKTKQKYFTVGDKRITFCNYVGVIHVKGLTIEILPKADKSNDSGKWHSLLIKMLHECRLLKLDSISNVSLKLMNHSLLDLYFAEFIGQVEYLTHTGLKKSYRRKEENLNKVKGRIVFNRHIARNTVHKERFYVENKIYDCDNKLNQMLKKALVILNSLTVNHRYISRIKNLLVTFEDIRERNFSEKDFRKIQFNRNTERYRYAIKLAEMIILNYSPDLKSGANDVLAILFDMNMLFEEFVYRRLKYNLSPDGYTVRRQNSRRFWKNRKMRPDILVSKDGKNIVIDTKWKILNADKLYPSDADLRQVFVYNLYFDAEKGVLLYPRPDKNEIYSKPITGRYRDFGRNTTGDTSAESGLDCSLAFYDLCNPNNTLNRNIPEGISSLFNTI
jgi:5-methylcytosine-specific restriction enzyme subunit McrC